MTKRFLLPCSAFILAVGMIAFVGPITAQQPIEPALPDDANPNVEEDGSPRFYLGLQLAPTPEILTRYVERLKDGGVMVAGVAPGSPADEAGFRREDQILSVNGLGVKSPEDVVDKVIEGEGKPLELEVLRGLEVKTIQASPIKMKRPPMMNPGQADARGNVVPRDCNGFRFFGPGQIVLPEPKLDPFLVKPSLLSKLNLPEDVMMRVEKQGDGPAKLHVERDGKTWDVTEKEIDTLPQDLQDLAKNFLGRIDSNQAKIIPRDPNARDALGNPYLQDPLGDRRVMPFVPPGVFPDFREMQKEMRRDMEELRGMIEELRNRAKQQVEPNEDETAGAI